MTIRVWELSSEDAKAYLDHVVTIGSIRLSDFAHHMASTGGPVEGMDGTVESLGPLWRWYLERMKSGFPEIPAGSAPSRTRFLEMELSDLTGRAAYAIEPVAHYLLEILRTYRPDAHWGIYSPQYADEDQVNATVVKAGDLYQSPYERLPYGIALTVLKDMGGMAPPDFLWDRLKDRLDFESFGQPAPAHGSILAQYLQLPRISEGDPRRTPPVVGDERSVGVDPGRTGLSPERLFHRRCPCRSIQRSARRSRSRCQ